jgi:predicted TIM-barrel fold metal-dependent hydrolase
VEKMLAQIGEEALLFGSDWPHWQWEGDTPPLLAPRMARENGLATYPRLNATVPA